MSWRSLFEKHFGADAVLWTIEDAQPTAVARCRSRQNAAGALPEPSDADLEARMRELALRDEARAWADAVVARLKRQRAIAAVERAIRGEVPGLTDDERARLPELLARLKEETP